MNCGNVERGNFIDQLVNAPARITATVPVRTKTEIAVSLAGIGILYECQRFKAEVPETVFVRIEETAVRNRQIFGRFVNLRIDYPLSVFFIAYARNVFDTDSFFLRCVMSCRRYGTITLIFAVRSSLFPVLLTLSDILNQFSLVLQPA